MAGKVWLVGAGPGDTGLLTLKGKAALENAEVVIYDALVGAGVLALMPQNAEKINAGKRGGSHLLPQEEINRLLAEKALNGKRVVRLKGGEPFLFGRGGEEAEALKKAGVEYEIVPGVSSAIAVPTYAGIPVTHRGVSSSLHIFTGHKKSGEELDINFEALAKLGGTLVFLMGVKSVSAICEGLEKGGMSLDTPAAVVQNGTTAEQKTVFCTLGELPRRIAEEGICAPAVIVVGEVCTLGEKLSWSEAMPLFGRRVAITRPRGRQSELAERLAALGAEVIKIPSIRIEPIKPNEPLISAVREIGRYTWLVFTSPAGADALFSELYAQNMDARSLHGVKIAAIGAGSAKKLREYGVSADLVPNIYDTAHLGAALAKCLKSSDRVLILRSRLGNPELTVTLKKSGAEVTDMPVYDTVYEKSEALNIKNLLTKYYGVFVVFTSASTVRGFAAAAGDLPLCGVKAVCIGGQTAAEAKKYGMTTLTAENATIDALCEVILNEK